MRRLIVIFVGMLLFVAATPALAAGCGADFQLLSIDATLDLIDERIYDATEWAEIAALIASLDANGDGLLCSKQYTPNQGQDKHWVGSEDGAVTDYVITLTNDNKAQGRG